MSGRTDQSRPARGRAGGRVVGVVYLAAVLGYAWLVHRVAVVVLDLVPPWVGTAAAVSTAVVLLGLWRKGPTT